MRTRLRYGLIVLSALVFCGCVFAGEGDVDPARLGEIEALGHKDDETSRGTLLKLMQNDAAAAAEREAAVKALALTHAGGLALLGLAAEDKIAEELKATASLACAGSPDAEVRTQGEKSLPVAQTKDGLPLLPIPKLAQMAGDGKAGEAVFKNAKGPNCIGCHQIGEEGRMVGPPLTNVGEKLSKEQLYEAILTPSASILMGYENWVIKVKGGAIQQGLKVEDTDDHVTLKDIQGEYHDIPAGDVLKKVRQTISIMPEGLIKAMTRTDLVNVVEFLSQQKYK